MSQDELSGPDLGGVVADAEAVGLPHVVIGGFSVIAHGYVRAVTTASELLIPASPEADAAIVRFLERIEARRFQDDEVVTAEEVGVVGFKRLAGRPQDKLDLSELEAIYGELPIEPIPGLDS